METERRISTGIDGLDEAIDYLRPGDTVVWQCEHISDYMYVATRFVTNVARKGDRIVYIRFADHEEIMDTAALRERGANVEKYELDPRVGFETFAVQVHRIIDKEPLGTFFVFDCLSDLQKYWFSDLMISNFFLLINPFLIQTTPPVLQPQDLAPASWHLQIALHLFNLFAVYLFKIVVIPAKNHRFRPRIFIHESSIRIPFRSIISSSTIRYVYM